MRVLLDTHVYLWALQDHPRMPASFTEAIRDTDNIVLVSAVSVWEAAVKHAAGRLELHPDVDLVGDIAASGFQELPITAAHAARSATLPAVHADPFDRLLVAQAIVDDLRLATLDDQVRQYPDVLLLRA